MLAVGSLASLWGQAPVRKRVAVFDFDNAAVQGGTNFVFFQTAPPNLGKAAADLLITRLVQGATVSVIERAALDKLLAEQNLTNSDRTDPMTAAKLGRVLGVDVIILGAITQYDYEDKTTGGGHAPIAGFGGGMTTKHDIKARVQISARLVSPDTAEVLGVSQGAGEIIRKGVKVDVRETSRVAMTGGGGAGNPMMNEAMNKAIVQLSGQLEQTFPKLPARIPVIDGLVADVNESGRLILNVGSRNGVKEGDRLQVWRAGKEVRDPATGKVLLRDDTLLSEAVVTRVNETSSFATCKDADKVKTGDIVKSPPKQ
jgi:curli biogenesis system outer membrane secretion channel CsgG